MTQPNRYAEWKLRTPVKEYSADFIGNGRNVTSVI
jgi:hypothetical protein